MISPKTFGDWVKQNLFNKQVKRKLDTIEEGSTVNESDAYLLDRENHTGTQTASTISDLDTSNVPENGNLYFTNALARNAVSAVPFKALSYNYSTGEFDMNSASNFNNGYLSASDWVTFYTKEPSLGSSTTNHYLKGDRSWSLFKTDVLSTDLFGLSNLLDGDLSVSDSILTAFGKLRGNINSINLKDYNWFGKNYFLQGVETTYGNINTFQNYLDNTTDWSDWSINFGTTTILSTTEIDPFGKPRAIQISMANELCAFLRDVSTQVPDSTEVNISFWVKRISGPIPHLEILVKGAYSIVALTDEWVRHSYNITTGTAFYLAIQSFNGVFNIYGLQVEDADNLSPYIYTNNRLSERFQGASIDEVRVENKIIFGDNSQFYSESGVLKYKDPSGSITNLT